MPPARSARAVPGPIAAIDRAGERARVADLLEQPLGAVGRRDAEEVERATGRAASTSSGSVRIAGASTTARAELAQPRGERARLRAGARDDDACGR